MTKSIDMVSAAQDIQKDKLHIYILVWQSHLQGGGLVEDYPVEPNPRILKVTGKTSLEIAGEPLCDRPGLRRGVARSAKTGKDPTIGPGMYFAQEMLDAAPPDVSIGLVPLGIGGARVAGWEQVVNTCRDALVSRIRDAQTVGSVKGIVWHAGPSDSRMKVFDRFFGPRFVLFLKELCANSGLPQDTPTVIGHVGPCTTRTDDTHFVDLVDRQGGVTPDFLPYCTVGEATPTPGTGKSLHYPTAAQEIMGKRYAEAMQKQAACASVTEQGPAVWWPWMDKEENVAIGRDVVYNDGGVESCMAGVGEGAK